MQHRPWKKSKFQSTTLIAVVVLVVILFISVGYFFVIPDRDDSDADDELLADLQLNHDLWQSNRPWSFRYVVERDCICAEAIRKPYAAIHVGDSLTAQFLELLGANGLEDSGTPPDPLFVDDLFAIAIDAVNGPGQVEVVFAPLFGYPTTLKFDRLGRTGESAFAIFIRDFEVIEYDQGTPTGNGSVR